MLNLEFSDAAFNPTVDSLFIPVADLPGVDAAELAAAEDYATKEGKALLAFYNQLHSTVSPAAFGKLGLTVTKGTPANGGGIDLVNQVFTVLVQSMVDLAASALTPIPVPTAGDNSGIGDFAIADIFPGAVTVAASAATGAAGVAFPMSLITAFGGNAIGAANYATGQDNRADLFALLQSISGDVATRSADTQSAVVNRALGAVQATAIPAAFTQATNPTSGIASAEVPFRGLIQRTASISIQLQLNQTTQSFDVHVA